MSFEITIWKFVISFSIFKEVEPGDYESEMLYNVTTNEAGEIQALLNAATRGNVKNAD